MKKPMVGKKMSVSWPPQALAETTVCWSILSSSASGERIGMVSRVRAVAPGMRKLNSDCSQKMVIAVTSCGTERVALSSQYTMVSVIMPLSMTTAMALATPQSRAATIMSRMPALTSSQISCGFLPAIAAAAIPISRNSPPMASKPRFLMRIIAMAMGNMMKQAIPAYFCRLLKVISPLAASSAAIASRMARSVSSVRLFCGSALTFAA